MCRTVSDAVHVLDAIVGYDELDAEATGAASKYIPHGGYRQFLRIDGLRGKRIGVLKGFFEQYEPEPRRVYEKHLSTMRLMRPKTCPVDSALFDTPFIFIYISH